MDKMEIGDTTLYLGNCIDLLPELAPDAVVSDPPYGMDYRRSGHCGGHGVSRAGWNRPSTFYGNG